MKNKILSKVDEIIDVIKSSEEYTKYIKVAEKMNNHKGIMNLIDEIKILQQKIVKDSSLNKDITLLEQEINKRLEQLESYPIYIEYITLQEELNNSMSLVKEGIEKHINNITN